MYSGSSVYKMLQVRQDESEDSKNNIETNSKCPSAAWSSFSTSYKTQMFYRLVRRQGGVGPVAVCWATRLTAELANRVQSGNTGLEQNMTVGAHIMLP